VRESRCRVVANVATGESHRRRRLVVIDRSQLHHLSGCEQRNSVVLLARDGRAASDVAQFRDGHSHRTGPVNLQAGLCWPSAPAYGIVTVAPQIRGSTGSLSRCRVSVHAAQAVLPKQSTPV
jgi:hypothetical protein